MKKQEGSIQYSLCVMLLMICVIILIYVMNMRIVTNAKINVDDAITGANLASAIIDIDEYKQTGEIYSYGYSDLSDSSYAYIYDVYKDVLKANLGLEEVGGKLNPTDDTLIKSNVKIMEYYVYDVEGNDVILKKIVENAGSPNYSCGLIDDEGHRETDIAANIIRFEDGKGSVEAPDGTKIRTLTIYSKLKFNVESVLGHTRTVEKEHSVDVMKNNIN